MQQDKDDQPIPLCPVPATLRRLATLSHERSGLVRQCDVRGLLHCHTAYSDGAHNLRDMVHTAREIGLEYLGFSDHVRSGAHPDGLAACALARQHEEIEALREECPDFDILQGVEVAMDHDGRLPLDEEALSRFDYVIVSLGDCAGEDPGHLTERAVRAIMHPCTTILSKPIGTYMLAQPPVPMDLGRVLQAAAEARVAVEVNAMPAVIDPDWQYCHLAQQHGVLLSINPDAHRAARLVDYRHGVELIRKAGLCCRQILNTLTAPELREFLRRGA